MNLRFGGFKSHNLKFNGEVNLNDLQQLDQEEVDLVMLKAARLVGTTKPAASKASSKPRPNSCASSPITR